MFRSLLLLYTLFTYFTDLSAQINADSLLQVASAIEEDEARTIALEDYVVGKKYADFDNPLPLFQARWELARASGDFQREARTALDVIRAGNFVGAFALADSLSFLYAEQADRVESPRNRVDVYHEAAKAAFFSQVYDQAIRYDSAALLLTPLVDPARVRDSLKGHLLNYLGKSFNASGQFVAAATTLADGIELVRTTRPDTTLMLELFTELGIVYSQIGLYDRAVEYLDQSDTYGQAQPQANKVGLQVNIGRNLLLTQAYEAARDRYLRALSIPVRESMALLFKPYAYNGLVEAHYRLANRDSVNHYYAIFSAFLEANPDQKGVNPFLYQQSSWLGDLVNNRLAAATVVGEDLMAQARASGDPADLLYYTELLAETYRRRGNYQQADALSQELLVRKDSIRSANRNDALLLYYNQFETQEKENEILRLDVERAEISASRRLFRSVAGLLALLLITGLFFFFKLRKARAALAEQNVQLGKLNATKDRFFGIIAHDLRNPIAALKTADRQVTRLYDRGRPEDVRSVVGSISQTAGRLSGLLDNLLQWALSQSDAIELKRTPLSLAEEVTEIVDLYQPAAALKDISLTHSLTPEVEVLADPNALQTILRNLVGNAVKFTPAGQGKQIALAYRREGKMDVIDVRDEGPGLTESAKAQLFQLKDRQTNRGRAAGTGLGLVLCQDLAELHGGRIEVESTPGEGAVFSVWLPARG